MQGNPQVVFGTCDGTGVAINVCLGFIPRYVKVWNKEDAGTLLPIAEWCRDFALTSAQDEGILHKGISDTDFDREVLTTAGISAYAGGDEIQYDATSGNWEVTTNFPAGASVEELYVDGLYEREATTDPAYRCIGDRICPELRHGAKVKTPQGFTIGTNANLNADGEQLTWMVIR